MFLADSKAKKMFSFSGQKSSDMILEICNNSTFATMAASEQMMSLDLDLRSLTKVKVTLPTR